MNLLTEKSTSCGCMFKKSIDNIVGKIFGRLTVIKLDKIENKKTFWLCQCNCGNNNLISIESDSLKRGDSQSCGCLWIESISGENNWNWKDGITKLYQHLRNIIQPWVVDTFIKNDRKCMITGSKAEVIHHLINFDIIVKNTLKELSLPIKKHIGDYSIEEIQKINKIVLEKHYLYNCGIPLRKDIHILFHSIYGYKNNSIEQFRDFINKIYNNEIRNTLLGK